MGVSWQLRQKHGYTKDEADALAQQLRDPESTCAICGIPTSALESLGRFLRGGAKFNKRLSVDRIDVRQPHHAENTRLLCMPCNAYRRDAKRTDAQVLRWTQKQYFRLFRRGHLKPSDVPWLKF